MVARIKTPNAGSGEQHIENYINCCNDKYCREKVFPLAPKLKFTVETEQQRHCYRCNKQYGVKRHGLTLEGFNMLLNTLKYPAEPNGVIIRTFCNISF